MAKTDRLKIIQELQSKRNSLVITYITSTRPGAEVAMAMDSIRKIYDHIVAHKKSGKEMNIDLVLYSNGGDGTVPWRLVTLLREYSKKLSVLIPFRAFSAATLTALGADEIFMHPMGMLGPTDPTVSNDFNPPVNPAEPQGKKKGISVEDVTAYINLIKEDASITHEDELVQAFNKLPENIHPLALGNVKRSLAQSRMMATKLLSLHMLASTDEHPIQEIVDSLTSKLYYHGHPINRIEAERAVGIRTIAKPDTIVEDLIWNLYLQYEEEMKLESPFSPIFEFMQSFPQLATGQKQKKPKASAKLVYIESVHKTDLNVLEYEIIGAMDPNGIVNTQLLTLFQGWTIE